VYGVLSDTDVKRHIAKLGNRDTVGDSGSLDIASQLIVLAERLKAK